MDEQSIIDYSTLEMGFPETRRLGVFELTVKGFLELGTEQALQVSSAPFSYN